MKPTKPDTSANPDPSQLSRVTKAVAGHIRQPYTLAEICSQIEEGDYSAELILQHMLRWADSTLNTTP